MEQRISMISLGVADLPRSVAFYVDGLGWQVAPASNDQIVFIQLNGLALGLYPRDKLAADAQIEGFQMDEPKSAPPFYGFTLAYNGRDRAEVDRTMKHAKTAGAKIVKPAQEVFWGGYSGYFADPDGFLWEVAHNPNTPITEDGNTLFA